MCNSYHRDILCHSDFITVSVLWCDFAIVFLNVLCYFYIQNDTVFIYFFQFFAFFKTNYCGVSLLFVYVLCTYVKLLYVYICELCTSLWIFNFVIVSQLWRIVFCSQCTDCCSCAKFTAELIFMLCLWRRLLLSLQTLLCEVSVLKLKYWIL